MVGFESHTTICQGDVAYDGHPASSYLLCRDGRSFTYGAHESAERLWSHVIRRTSGSVFIRSSPEPWKLGRDVRAM
jgi:hypothetical protein